MKFKHKVKGKPVYLAETISHGIDWSVEWPTYERLSTQNQRRGHFKQILARLAERSRRYGMVELARHLGLDESEFDVTEIVHGISLDRSLGLDGSEISSLERLKRWSEDLAQLGIFLESEADSKH